MKHPPGAGAGANIMLFKVNALLSVVMSPAFSSRRVVRASVRVCAGGRAGTRARGCVCVCVGCVCVCRTMRVACLVFCMCIVLSAFIFLFFFAPFSLSLPLSLSFSVSVRCALRSGFWANAWPTLPG